MSKVLFVADFFSDEVLGGGELNNEEFIKIANNWNYSVSKIKPTDLKENQIRDNFLIIGNFLSLSEDKKQQILNFGNYCIYEHDHKYLLTRDPSSFDDYLAPKDQLCNIEFYNNAKAVFCQSKLHADILKKNVIKANVENLGGNLWTDSNLDFLLEQSKEDKLDKVSIWNSSNPIKNTYTAKKFCLAKKYKFDLIGGLPYEQFLQQLTKNNTFVFFPLTVETLCRVVVEARMAGMKTITNKKIGALSEDWFNLKGEDLIKEMREKRNTIPKRILSYV